MRVKSELCVTTPEREATELKTLFLISKFGEQLFNTRTTRRLNDESSASWEVHVYRSVCVCIQVCVCVCVCVCVNNQKLVRAAFSEL